LDSSSLTKPKPLTVRAEAGVFLMLAVGISIGVVILILEHLVFKYILPALRKKNKNCFWKSPNLMFFSQVSFFILFYLLFKTETLSVHQHRRAGFSSPFSEGDHCQHPRGTDNITVPEECQKSKFLLKSLSLSLF